MNICDCDMAVTCERDSPGRSARTEAAAAHRAARRRAGRVRAAGSSVWVGTRRRRAWRPISSSWTTRRRPSSNCRAYPTSLMYSTVDLRGLFHAFNTSDCWVALNWRYWRSMKESDALRSDENHSEWTWTDERWVSCGQRHGTARVVWHTLSEDDRERDVRRECAERDELADAAGEEHMREVPRARLARPEAALVEHQSGERERREHSCDAHIRYELSYIKSCATLTSTRAVS